MMTNMETDREHFRRHNQLNTIEYERCVFCDEIDDYVIYPYRGSLKDIPGYLTNRKGFQAKFLYLGITAREQILFVPVTVVETDKRIYIEERNFNKFWRMIRDNVRRGIFRKNTDYDALNEKIQRMVNLEFLQAPNKMPVLNEKGFVEYQEKEIDIEVQRMISKRAQAMDDNRIRVVYSKSGQIVHDKTCHLVERIKYWDFGASERLPENMAFCPQCVRRTYIRKAIKNDLRRFSWYLRFFDETDVKTGVLINFLEQGNVELHMDSMEEMTIKFNEDTWKVRKDDQNRYILYHNNYVRVNEKERLITSGFHLQNYSSSNLRGIMKYIQGYDWNVHLEPKVEETADNENSSEQVKQLVLVTWVHKIVRMHMKFLKKC